MIFERGNILMAHYIIMPFDLIEITENVHDRGPFLSTVRLLGVSRGQQF